MLKLLKWQGDFKSLISENIAQQMTLSLSSQITVASQAKLPQSSPASRHLSLQHLIHTNPRHDFDHNFTNDGTTGKRGTISQSSVHLSPATFQEIPTNIVPGSLSELTSRKRNNFSWFSESEDIVVPWFPESDNIVPWFHRVWWHCPLVPWVWCVRGWGF